MKILKNEMKTKKKLLKYEKREVRMGFVTDIILQGKGKK